MKNQLKNMLIGLFVIIGCFLIISIILFIKPKVGNGGQTLHVRFSNINGISIGTPVTYAGNPIGEVSSIDLVPEARQQNVNQYGQVFPYLLTLKIDSSYKIYATDQISVQTQGLLGEKYVAIFPEQIQPGTKTHVITEKDVLFANSNDLLESAVNELSSLSEKIENALGKFTNWIDKYGDTLGSAIHSFDLALGEAYKTIKSFNDLDMMADIKTAIHTVTEFIDNLDTILVNLSNSGFFDNMSLTMKNIEEITTQIASGHGTVGKIIYDDGLYLQINALMTKANTLMNDINQYGLLFNYNKHWQRDRAKLMSEADRIKDPKAFQNYMNQQIDQMSTTLERMNMLTNRLSAQAVASNKKFRQELKEFMQQLNSLSERVKLFNEEINEQKIKNPCE